MILAAEYGLKVIAMLVILAGVLQFAVLLVGTGMGVIALFVAGIAAVRVLSSAAVLLALHFWGPWGPDVANPTGLLWLVGPASLLTVVLFDLALDGPTLRLVRRCGLGPLGQGTAEVIAGGVVAALALEATAHFVPGAAGLSVVSALAAGLTGSFVLYYVELSSSGTPSDVSAVEDLLD